MRFLFATWRVILGVAALATLTFVSNAQIYYGTLRGTITDSSGAVHPGVEVTITEVTTNLSSKAVSNEVGNYVFPNVVPGRYRVAAEQEGFKRFLVEGVELAATQDFRVDIRMEVGNVTESVTVEGSAQLVETERGTLTDTKSRYVFVYTPVNSDFRSIFRLMLLSPGVSGGDFGNSIGGNNRGRNATFSIDGIPMIDGWSGNAIGPAFTYLDSYREFRVDISNTNATVGTSSAVSVVSESGTNEVHGEAWLHYNAVGFQARPFFAPARASGPPTYRPNLKIGGPVWLGGLYDGRNRTFFHFTWQGLRGSQAPQVSNLVVPTTGFRAGNFAGLPTPVRDPLNGAPFAGGIIPNARISPVARYFQDTFFPAPNSGEDRFQNVDVFPNRDTQHTTRVDHRLSDRNLLFGRFLYHRFEFTQWDQANPLIGIRDQYRAQRNIILSDTHTFSPTLVGEFRYGYAQDDSKFQGPNRGLDIVAASGLQLQDLADVPAMPRIEIAGLAPIGQTNIGGWTWDNHYVNAVFHKTHGKHNLRFGFDAGIYVGTLLPTSPSLTYGTYSFNGRFSGHPYSDYLLGLMDVSARSTSVGFITRRRTNYEAYVTDDYKITSRLSLNLGLRYSLLDPGVTRDNLTSNFSPIHNALLVPDSAAAARVHPGFPASVPIATADSVGLGRRLARYDRNNLAPRFGLAWRPLTKDDGFVLRGAFGWYYVAQQPNPPEGGGAPFELRENFTNFIDSGRAAFGFPNPFPATGFVLGGTGATGLDPFLRTPYTMQYNFTVEKQKGQMAVSASYLGTLARKNVWRRDLRQVPADTRPFTEKLAQAPFPYLFNALFTENGANHSYHALFLKAERKHRNGLFYTTNFNWSRSVGDDLRNPEDAFNRVRERSADGDIPRLRLVAVALYEMPFGRGKKYGGSISKVADTLLGGWMVGGTYVAQTGFLFNPTFAGTDPGNTNIRSGRPDRIANGNLPAGERTIERWFDTSAFTVPANGIGRFGTSGANVLEGPGRNVFHFGLNKDVNFTERVRARLEMISTNFFNHPNFSNPAAVVGTPAYGRVLSTNFSDGNRNFSLTARIFF
ncbi:MAG: TonB-dependent receptor [Bryobacterales bacterium]|nr:TonB-dependent receptor [Bryobacterales bacterium]